MPTADLLPNGNGPSVGTGRGSTTSRVSRTSQCASALNLDTFEIQTGTETGQPGATITVGEQVGQRLYVKLRQGVGADNVSKFVLDHQLTNLLGFESTMTPGGSPTRNVMNRVQQSGADLIFMFSF